MCLYNLEKAYDSVKFSVLLKRLFQVRVNSKTWQILRSCQPDILMVIVQFFCSVCMSCSGGPIDFTHMLLILINHTFSGLSPSKSFHTVAEKGHPILPFHPHFHPSILLFCYPSMLPYCSCAILPYFYTSILPFQSRAVYCACAHSL